MHIGRMLRWTADRYPGRIAVGGPLRLTYRQRDARPDQLARAPATLAVRPGDAVTAAERAVHQLSAVASGGSGLPSVMRSERHIAVEPTCAAGQILRRELTEGRYQPLAGGCP